MYLSNPELSSEASIGVSLQQVFHIELGTPEAVQEAEMLEVSGQQIPRQSE